MQSQGFSTLNTVSIKDNLVLPLEAHKSEDSAVNKKLTFQFKNISSCAVCCLFDRYSRFKPKDCNPILSKKFRSTLYWPCKRSVFGAPGGVLEVVAQPVRPAVLARSTLHIGQEGRTHLSDQGLRCVYQRKSFLHLFIAQPVTAIIKSQ